MQRAWVRVRRWREEVWEVRWAGSVGWDDEEGDEDEGGEADVSYKACVKSYKRPVPSLA